MMMLSKGECLKMSNLEDTILVAIYLSFTVYTSSHLARRNTASPLRAREELDKLESQYAKIEP